MVKHRSFKTKKELGEWLAHNHAIEKELWVRIFKKNSGKQSVDWNDCVVAAIAWGWIDSQRNSLDNDSFIQRLTPRRPGSNWSKRNRAHAESLIREGTMQPSGLVHVELARETGRWSKAT